MVSLGCPRLLRGDVHPATGNRADLNGHEVAARLRRSVVTAPASVGAPAPEVALKEFRRGRGVYEVVDLAPYRSNLVSLAANLDGSPKLAHLLPPKFAFFLDGENELMRRTREETNAVVVDSGCVKPYAHAQQETLLDFSATAAFQGMLNFVERAKARAGVFFCVEVVEDKTPLYFRRETRKHLLQNSFICWLVLFGDLFPGSRLNGTISSPLMLNRFTVALPSFVWLWIWQTCLIVSTA